MKLSNLFEETRKEELCQDKYDKGQRTVAA